MPCSLQNPGSPPFAQLLVYQLRFSFPVNSGSVELHVLIGIFFKKKLGAGNVHGAGPSDPTAKWKRM
jgi:hypothetical protein